MELLLGKGMESVSGTVIEELGICFMYWIGKCGREGRICCIGSK